MTESPTFTRFRLANIAYPAIIGFLLGLLVAYELQPEPHFISHILWGGIGAATGIGVGLIAPK